MKWKNFFKPVGNMDPKEARVYMAEHRVGAYTLLDVRQPREYEESRIPGATLIPLPQLSDRLKELDPEKPVLAYCAIGGRSRAAAQLLAGQGFKEVYNLKGGIKAWNGLTAEGPVDFGSKSTVGNMSPHEVLDYALAMEKGLALFYHKAARENEDKDLADLLTKLAGFEDKHQHKLLALRKTFESTRESTPVAEQEAASVMEGGFAPDDFFEKNRSLMDSPSDILSLSMMLETQALDLYTRFAGYMENETSRNLLQQIADDEKAHLKALGEMMERGHY